VYHVVGTLLTLNFHSLGDSNFGSAYRVPLPEITFLMPLPEGVLMWTLVVLQVNTTKRKQSLGLPGHATLWMRPRYCAGRFCPPQYKNPPCSMLV
jgi:hypothetical protein